MSKQSNELQILTYVYEPSEWSSIEPSDKPDFLITRQDGAKFGVEVTELFPSESFARTYVDPEYLPQLFEGGRHRHRDDVSALNVVRVNVTEEDGTIRIAELPAVLSELPTDAEHFAAMADKVARKNYQALGYASDLAHVNLVIRDHFSPTVGEFSTREYMTPAMREALAASPFREVYVISSTATGTPVYRALRQLLLLEDFFMFGQTFQHFAQSKGEFEADLLPSFVHAKSLLGEAVVYSEGGRTPMAIVGGSGIAYLQDATSIFSFGDHDIPTSTPMGAPPRQDLALVTDAFVEKRSTMEFVSQVALPVKNIPDLSAPTAAEYRIERLDD
ncbi:MAG: hypothetical protein KF761_14470 [Salinibacterium sp.]|nr:hypothetical protein [Salinibacterium sp.]